MSLCPPRRNVFVAETNEILYYMMVVCLQEAHVFSTSDGMALEVFVVEGWDGDDVSFLTTCDNARVKCVGQVKRIQFAACKFLLEQFFDGFGMVCWACCKYGMSILKSMKIDLNLQAEGLRQAVLLAVDAREEGHSKYRDAELKAAVESIQYEDWAVDFNQVCFSPSLLLLGEA